MIRVIPILNNEYKVIVVWGSPKKIYEVVTEYGHQTTIDKTKLKFQENRGGCYMTEGRYPVIAMLQKPKTAENIGTLAHEATHAIEDIFQTIAEDSRGEVYAHSIGAIVRGALK